MPAVATVTITVHDEPPADDAARVDDGLHRHNLAAAPLHEVRPLACFARSSDGVVIGGAVGRTWGECAELQQLWVDEAHRRRGLGKQLVRRFEQRALERGCRRCYLDSFSFQAPALYGALGYERMLHLEGFAPGVAKSTYVREFRAATPVRPPGSPPPDRPPA